MKITSDTRNSFQPFSITITFESADEAISLMAALNRSDNDIQKEEFAWEEYFSPHSIFYYIKSILEERGMKYK